MTMTTKTPDSQTYCVEVLIYTRDHDPITARVVGQLNGDGGDMARLGA